MMARARNVSFAAAVLAAVAFAAAAWFYLSEPGLHLYRTFESPDGHDRVEVWRQPQAFMMPGQSGDAPGYARLVDASGNVLAEVPLEMVQLVDEVDWSDGHASMSTGIFPRLSEKVAANMVGQSPPLVGEMSGRTEGGGKGAAFRLFRT